VDVFIGVGVRRACTSTSALFFWKKKQRERTKEKNASCLDFNPQPNSDIQSLIKYSIVIYLPLQHLSPVDSNRHHVYQLSSWNLQVKVLPESLSWPRFWRRVPWSYPRDRSMGVASKYHRYGKKKCQHALLLQNHLQKTKSRYFLFKSTFL
jgi:hypothetical protein